MDANFADPLSNAFTQARQGKTFNDARRNTMLKNLYIAIAAGCGVPVHPLRPPCGWNW